MTGFLALVAALAGCAAVAEACTRRIARRHNQTAARIDRTGREA